MRGIGSLTGACLSAALLSLSSCSAPHAGGAAQTGPCARALPVAFQAVGGAGKLIRAEQLGHGQLHRLLTPRELRLRRHRRHREACVFVFRGSYKPGSVRGAPPRASGRYAVLIVRVRSALVLRAMVAERLPAGLP